MDINIINLNEINIDNITLSNEINLGNGKKKISIGYNENQELYMLTPHFINNMIFQENQKYEFIKLIFEPMLGDMKKFYNFITTLESKIKKTIKLKNHTMNQLIRDESIEIFDESEMNDETIKNMYLKISSSLRIYDNQSRECSIDKLIKGWKFKCLIKIDSIWINTTSKKYGLCVHLYQLKMYQPIHQLKCLIDCMDDKVVFRPKVEYTETKTQPIIQKSEKLNNNFIPNIKDLLQIKNTLKKVL